MYSSCIFAVCYNHMSSSCVLIMIIGYIYVLVTLFIVFWLFVLSFLYKYICFCISCHLNIYVDSIVKYFDYMILY